MHTACAWTDCEKRYSQIQKESNALLTGITSNKTYLLGVDFEAVVDHKPLLPLYNNPRRPKQMRVDSRLLKPQHLYGIWSGLTPYRLPLDTLSEYLEP